ncbi:probable pectate lyase P59 [Andrographis paniculata]|uniref:probable pectate lyase P59 n=1 Tax=Andrographis paniculata TaxID=175694 RepID=UPI0021E6FDE4|nr:probable pectate lyase P59 [Andrographis paniculata]
MEEDTKLILTIFFISVAVLIPTIRANIAEYDDVLRYRAELSINRTLESYEPDPEEVIGHLNHNVHKMLKEQGYDYNGTRRELSKGYTGPCRATNPIDSCWRCDPNWARDRSKLADCVLGFGRKTTGGKGGPIYVVTDPSDEDVLNPKPGTLRHAVIQDGPLWIIFDRNMLITLKQELLVTGDKTIDGRGAAVHIAYGAGITIQYVKNVIIHGLKIHDIVSTPGGLIRDSMEHAGMRTQSDGDGITLFGAQDVWLDHLSMTKCADGIIDVVQASTCVTISNGHFTDHDHTMLFGATDDYVMDEKMQVTVAFNHFGKRLVQRMPRVRYGYIHIVNNDYTHWKMYAIGGSQHPTIISQGNRYIADLPFAKQVTKREIAPESEWRNWVWVSQGDLFLRGAYFVTSGPQDWYTKHPDRYDHVNPGPADLVGDITMFAGALGCRVDAPC